MRSAAALLLWAVLAAAPPPAAARDGDDGEKVYRANALAHARALEAAHRRLQRHITEDAAAATPGSWPQDIPPASTGWVRDWTDRGLRARYCADTLVVYASREGALHGGTAQRSVQAAPRLYGPADTRGPALHWLRRTGTTGVEAHGGAGRTSVTLPTCMTSGLPVERVALASAAGAVPDPWVDTWVSRRADPEWRACPAGRHVPGGLTASGQRWRVVRTRTMSRHGRPVGAEAVESQTLETDHCVADYTRHECVPNAAPPPVAVARYYRVEADASGRTKHRQFTPSPLPPNPCASLTAAPTVSVTETELHRASTCAAAAGAGWTGTARDRRMRRVTTFSWQADPVTALTPWVPDRSDCVRRTEQTAQTGCPSVNGEQYSGWGRVVRTRTARRTRASWSAAPVVHTPTWSNWRWRTMSCSTHVTETGTAACPSGQTGEVVRRRGRWKYLLKSAGAPSASLPPTTYGPWTAWTETSRTCSAVVVAADDPGNGPSGDPGDGGGPAGGGTSSGTGGGVTGDDTGVSSTDGTGSNQGLGDPGTHSGDGGHGEGDGGGDGGDGGGPGDGGDGGVGGENGGAW